MKGYVWAFFPHCEGEDDLQYRSKWFSVTGFFCQGENRCKLETIEHKIEEAPGLHIQKILRRKRLFLARSPLLFIFHPLVWLTYKGHVLSLQRPSLLLYSLLVLSYHRRTRCQQPSGLCWPPSICTPSHQQTFQRTRKGSSERTSTPLKQRLWFEDAGLLLLQRRLYDTL